MFGIAQAHEGAFAKLAIELLYQLLNGLIKGWYGHRVRVASKRPLTPMRANGLGVPETQTRWSGSCNVVSLDDGNPCQPV